ncbi:quinon protein alcohol dehydrogenase-like superfamily [Suillus subalutaceus]|uniref:quinon protein alcohol dehydrogenase-like superfamily n=1 Tax=Suillus subalutaceus TaxID=48586 RepID=UPI001B8715C2|nr:quinon protein alcohol dehydrogenase-like superfamily [Suillus subalutaceus]KAG1830929.1 quinon protein alcohol dehydrogenase-like superfamily [Suillus subalutaceus]
MSGLKNSPFGKRLRATHQDNEEDGPRRNRQRVNPIFYTATSSTTKDVTPESPVTMRDMYGDRFVPSRDAGDMRTSYHLMEESGPSTPSKSRIIPTESDALKEQANAIFTSILHTEVTPPSPRRPTSPQRPTTSSSATTTLPPSTPTRKRIFHYTSPATSANPSTPTRRLDTPTDEAYSMSPVRAESRQLLESPRRQLRSVCKTPYRVLDAPDLADDFYLNLVDWSNTNVLGVGLGSCVYLWTAHNAAVSKLCDLAASNDTVSSVSWVQKGTLLAIGTLSGRMHIYDANTLQVQRSYNNAHTQRIGALAWNSHILSSGSRDRMVHHRDVREASHRPFKRCAGHRQEVCGLKWARDGGPLASGGNDNKVCIWDLRGSKRTSVTGSSTSGSGSVDDAGNGSGDAPLWKFHEHTAAVKALAWDPHVSGVLATGGGTQDKHIRFWNTFNGTMLSELDTGSQVCNLIWSLTSHELVSTHGFSSTTAQNQICIWKYPTLNMVASLTGHTHRVLYLAMSPDGETIVTGAGDETLRFWNAFPKKEGGEKRETRLDYGRLIR